MPATHSTTAWSASSTHTAVRWLDTTPAHSSSTAPAAISQIWPLRFRVRGSGGASPEGRRRWPARETRWGRLVDTGPPTSRGGRPAVGSMVTRVT
jgi:hypothetical protein